MWECEGFDQVSGYLHGSLLGGWVLAVTIDEKGEIKRIGVCTGSGFSISCLCDLRQVIGFSTHHSLLLKNAEDLSVSVFTGTPYWQETWSLSISVSLCLYFCLSSCLCLSHSSCLTLTVLPCCNWWVSNWLSSCSLVCKATLKGFMIPTELGHISSGTESDKWNGCLGRGGGGAPRSLVQSLPFSLWLWVFTLLVF